MCRLQRSFTMFFYAFWNMYRWVSYSAVRVERPLFSWLPGSLPWETVKTRYHLPIDANNKAVSNQCVTYFCDFVLHYGISTIALPMFFIKVFTPAGTIGKMCTDVVGFGLIWKFSRRLFHWRRGVRSNLKVFPTSLSLRNWNGRCHFIGLMKCSKLIEYISHWSI